MRILLTNYSEITSPGGVHKTLRELAKNLSLKGHNVMVLQANPLALPETEMKDGYCIQRLKLEFSDHMCGFDPRIYAYLKEFKSQFTASMDDDFNSAKAIGDLFELIRSINGIIQSSGFVLSSTMKESIQMSWRVAAEHGKIFGFDFKNEMGRAHQPGIDKILLNNEEIEELIEQRNFARKTKDFKKADEIRDRLKSFCIVLDDRKEGTLWRKES